MTTRIAKPRKKRRKERRARRSPEIVPSMIDGTPMRLDTIQARKRDLRVRAFRRKLLIAAPNLADDKYAPVTLTFCRISVLSLDVYRFLHQKGLVGADGELRASVDKFARLASVQLRIAERLGLTPMTFKSALEGKPFDLVAEIQRARSRQGDPEDAEVVRDGDERD